jgi:RHS repeat-associated protein
MRTLVCQAIILNLFIWPTPAVTLRPILDPASVLASTVGSTMSGAGSALSRFATSVVFIPAGPIMFPVPVLPIWPFQSVAPVARELSMAERIARVATVKVAPHKLVGYVGDSVTFIAMATDALGEPAHGAKFTWESSDPNKLTIDEAGRASLLHPGLVRVTARAGFAEQTALVLIRPTRRPLQTDEEWRADQDSLVGDGRQQTDDGHLGMLAGLVDRVAPTAYAQSGGQGADYGYATWPGQAGTPPFTALEDTRLGPVMPKSNFELPIPLVNLGGRGLATSLMLYYNSNVWGAYADRITQDTRFVFDPIQGWPSPGFSLGFGRIVYSNNYDGNYRYMLIDPNGTRHDLGLGSALGSNTLQTTDGSHATYVGSAVNGGTLYYNDGTKVTIGKVNNRLLPTQITDTNGNYVQVAYVSNTGLPGIAINYIVDTLGRVIQFNYGYGSATPSSIGTPTGTVNLSYQMVPMNYYYVLGNTVENAPASFYAVSSVTIPQRPTYTFSYSGYGMIYSTSAASAGGTATVTYNYPLGGEEELFPPGFTQRTESPNAVYSYGSDGITRPDGTKLVLSGPDREIRSTTNTTLAKTVSTMTTDPGGSPAIQSVVSYDDTLQQTKVDFDYDQYGNVVNKREYGYQISNAWQVRRRTHYNYINFAPYLSSYIRNRVTEVDVFDALQNTNDADDALIGKTLYGYDNYLGMGGMENYAGLASPPGHLSSYDTSQTTRGNLTDATTYSDVGVGTSVTHSNKVDIFGGVTKAQVDCCNQKSFTMTEATYWSKSSQTTSGDTSGIYLTSSASYDFNTLVATSQTNPDNQTTSYSYDAAGNPTGFTAPTGANGGTSYNAWSEPTSSTVNYNDGGVNKTITTSSVYDAWGQMAQSVDANGAQTNYTYDNMGHRLTQTNPFPQGGTPGPATTYQCDQLGRVTMVTLPDGNTIQTSYSGSVVTVTDQVNRKIKRESDGLGRLIKITEQDISTGALTQETTYTYDIAAHLIGVNQGGQTRSFKYDAEGHLLFERIPEMTATINDGTGTYWSAKYTYMSFGAVATKQDARGVITTYGYDTLNRLTSISYNTSGATGVATTPNVAYNYDSNPSSSTNGLLLSLSAGSGYSESYSYDSYKRVQSVTRTIDGHNYATSYQENTANQLTQMTYPSSRVINLGHDSKGRVTSVGSYLTSVTYNGIGQLTGTSLGNGVTESYSYDANRMQLTSQTATKSGGPTGGLMNLTYNYQVSPGQMGAGSTTGNAGQLMAINNNSTINDTAESAAYTYDNLGRLVSSNQTSNGATAQRRFAYDRWGNRTGAWDAVSGGDHIQAISLDQSAGVPTNRIQAVSSYNNDDGAPNYGGWLDGADCNGISGWVWNANQPNTPVNVDIYDGNTLIETVAANLFRQDLVNAGIGNGSHGYSIATPASLKNGAAHTIHVKFAGTSAELSGSPKSITCQAPASSAYGGWLDGANCNVIGGWAWDANQPNTPINVEIYDGTTLIATAAASQFRQDLLNAGLGNGYHGYTIVTPASLKNGAAHTIRVKFASTAAELSGSPKSITCGNYTYDACGNLTNDGAHSYTYDGENRLVSVDGGATGQYAYDPSNRCYKKVTGGATTHYVWQGSQAIAEYDGTLGAVITDYVYSGSRMIAKVSGGTTQYFLSDRLSVRLTLNASGNVLGSQGHLPFGEDFGESDSQEKHHFTSYERDSEASTDYALNRAYSPALGRFLETDPYKPSRHSVNPQSWNHYSYVGNDSVNLVDPMGLDPFLFIAIPSHTIPGWLATVFWNTLSFPGIGTPHHDPLLDSGNGDSGAGPIKFSGYVRVQSSCQNAVYLPEEPPAIWVVPEDDVWQDADAVATPRGILKIPDGCNCSVECDGGLDYKITCKCQFSPFGIKAPRTLAPGSEFPNPRDAGYFWAATRSPYTRTGGLPCPSCGITEYVFN